MAESVSVKVVRLETQMLATNKSLGRIEDKVDTLIDRFEVTSSTFLSKTDFQKYQTAIDTEIAVEGSPAEEAGESKAVEAKEVKSGVDKPSAGMSAKAKASTDIEYSYATTDAPTSGAIQHFIHWLPKSPDANVVVQ